MYIETSFTKSACFEPSQRTERRTPPSRTPSPHLTVGPGCGKSVPIRREPHTVDEAAVVLQEVGQLSGDRQFRKALYAPCGPQPPCVGMPVHGRL